MNKSVCVWTLCEQDCVWTLCLCEQDSVSVTMNKTACLGCVCGDKTVSVRKTVSV